MLVIDKINTIARIIYSYRGYQVPDNYNFFKAHHPMEIECWNTAYDVLLEICGWDENDVNLYANWKDTTNKL
jgi:hypothetical protein